MKQILTFASVVVTTFVVGVWAIRGFPTHLPQRTPVAQLQPTMNAVFGEDNDKEARELRVQAVLDDPENAKRNPLRMDVLQAATGYALSPCDKGMKANLIAAALAYAEADVRIRKCTPMFQNCDPGYEKAIATYSTPLDLRARAALHDAFEQGGISREDFPAAMQLSVMSLATSQGNSISACERPAERAHR